MKLDPSKSPICRHAKNSVYDRYSDIVNANLNLVNGLRGTILGMENKWWFGDVGDAKEGSEGRFMRFWRAYLRFGQWRRRNRRQIGVYQCFVWIISMFHIFLIKKIKNQRKQKKKAHPITKYRQLREEGFWERNTTAISSIHYFISVSQASSPLSLFLSVSQASLYC